MNKHTFSVDESNFESEVLGADVPVLVEATASYCGPCRALAPRLETLAAEAGGAYRVGILDTEACPGLTRKLAVRGVPTMIVFHAGQERARRLGLVGLDVLRELVQVAPAAPAVVHAAAR